MTNPTLGRFRQLLENILYIAAAIVLAGLVQAYLIRPFIVSGTSMDPTIRNNEYLIIDEVSYRFNPPARGDVVVFRSPPEPDKYYIKRVIGLPGETVKLEGNTITIINAAHPDGFKLNEPYITHEHNDYMTVKVPEGKYFVMGDNRNGSYDSRAWGTLPKSEIRGRALLRLLPVNKIEYLPGKALYE